VKEQAAGLMSDEHFTVDGTLIEAWAGQKSFAVKTKGTPRVEGIFTASRAVSTRTHPERTHFVPDVVIFASYAIVWVQK
jgi:hypothetical protein